MQIKTQIPTIRNAFHSHFVPITSKTKNRDIGLIFS